MEPDRIAVLMEHVADVCCAVEADRIAWRDQDWTLKEYDEADRIEACRSLGLPRVCPACRLRLAAELLALWERDGVKVTPVCARGAISDAGLLLLYPDGRGSVLWLSGQADHVVWHGWAAHAVIGGGRSVKRVQLHVYDPAPQTLADLLAEHEEAGEAPDDLPDLLR